MRYKSFIRNCCIFFSGWSKKGYSIFNGLGCEVRISRLAVHMYKNILLKSSSNGVIVNVDCTAEPDVEFLKLYCIPGIAICIRGGVYPAVNYVVKFYR